MLSNVATGVLFTFEELHQQLCVALERIGNLAEALGISQPGATRIVAQLIKKGVVSAEPGPVDQRQRIVSLTDYGQELVEHGRANVWPLIQGCVAQMLDDQRGPILSQLDHLEDELREKPFLDRI